MKKHNNAEERLNQELDWIEIIKSIRELKVLTKLILSQHQIQLLAFKKDNVITNQPLEKKEQEWLEHWLPFDNTANLKSFIYKTRVSNVIKKIDEDNITDIDKRLIEEITGEKPEVSDNHELPRGKKQHFTSSILEFSLFVKSSLL